MKRISNVDLVRNRVDDLETFEDVTVPATYETIVNVGAKVQGAKDYADNGLSLKEKFIKQIYKSCRC